MMLSSARIEVDGIVVYCSHMRAKGGYSASGSPAHRSTDKEQTRKKSAPQMALLSVLRGIRLAHLISFDASFND